MTADRIVRMLAAIDPITEGPNYWHWCVVCNERLVLSVDDHPETCPWRLAVEYVAAHPTTTESSNP